MAGSRRWHAPNRLVGLSLIAGVLGLLVFGLAFAVLGIIGGMGLAPDDLLLGLLVGGGLTAIVGGAAVAWLGQRLAPVGRDAADMRCRFAIR